MSDRLQGIFPAVWTPVTSAGELDRGALGEILSFVQGARVHGLMVMGSTAEFLRFSCEQRKNFLEEIASRANGLPLLVNITHICLEKAIDLGLHAKAAGAFAISALPPYFFPIEQEDLAAYFVQLAEAVQLPLVLYNFPEVVGKRIEIETIRSVANRVPLLGVKQSGSDFGYHKPLLELAREKHFVVMTGFDTRLAELLPLGAAGCVSGLSNAIADLMVALWEACSESDSAKVQGFARRLQEFGELLGQLSFPLNVMAAIEARGLKAGAFKTPVADRTQSRYRGMVQNLQDFYRRAELAIPPTA